MGGAASSRGGGGGRRRGSGKPRRAARPAAAGAGASGPRRTSRASSRAAAGANGKQSHAATVVKETIPSDYGAGRDLQERILADVERHGFSHDSAFAIRIALEEALVNAIKHGNRLDPGKKVHVESHITPKRAEITIEDEGSGFDRSAIPDPTLEENLHKCSGRGIHLIESYMDGVQWSRGGRRLKMVKENG